MNPNDNPLSNISCLVPVQGTGQHAASWDPELPPLDPELAEVR